MIQAQIHIFKIQQRKKNRQSQCHFKVVSFEALHDVEILEAMLRRFLVSFQFIRASFAFYKDLYNMNHFCFKRSIIWN